MAFNKLNREEDMENEDLKFVPLNIRQPFIEKDSNWIPIINMNYPSVNNITNNFIFGFSSSKSVDSIDYVPSSSYDNNILEDTNTYKLSDTENNVFNKDNSNSAGYMNSGILSGNNSEIIPNDNIDNDEFNLEFPSQVESEDLYSYNKDIKCKPINGAKVKGINVDKENGKKKEDIIGDINQTNYGMDKGGNINNVWATPNLDPTNSILGDPLNVNLGLGLGGRMEVCNPPNGISTNSISIKNEFINPFNNNLGNTLQNSKNQINMTCNNIKVEDLFMGSGDMVDNNNFQRNLLNNDINIIEENLLDERNEEFEEPTHMELLRKLSLGSECENFYRGSEEIVDKIFKDIEEKNSPILEMLKEYNLPDSVVTEIVRNTIKLALGNSNNE